MKPLHLRFDTSADTRFIAAMGDLTRENRLKDAIWTIDLLRVIHPNAELIIFGDGPDKDRLLEFRSRIASSHAVHFVPRTEAVDMLPQCFCYWHTSPHDELGLAEAMAIGIPTVAVQGEGDYRGTYFIHSQTGMIVPVGDCAEIARQTNLLMLDTDSAQKISATAKSFAASSFDLQTMLDSYHKVYAGFSVSSKAA